MANSRRGAVTVRGFLVLIAATGLLFTCKPPGTTPPPADGDVTAPTISSFTLSSNNPTAYSVISFSFSATDNVAVTGWLVNESSTAPTADASGWLSSAPTSYTVSSAFGQKTLYAWAKDAAGNVSSSKSFSVNYVQPGYEFTAAEGWDKKIDGGENSADMAYSLAIDSSGNVYVAGASYSSSAGFDWLVKKFSAAGTEDLVNWNKRIDGGANSADYAYALTIDNSGNVMVTGTTYTGGASPQWLWLVRKFTPGGVEDTANLWGDPLSGTSSGLPTPSGISVDSQGYTYVTGNVIDPTSGLDWAIKKFAVDGTENTAGWPKQIDGGSNQADNSWAITGKDAVYVVGSGSDVAGVSTLKDWWIKKFSLFGTEDSSFNIRQDGGSNVDDEAMSVAVGPSGNIYVVGTNGSNSKDWWIKKFSSTGIEDTSNWNKIVDDDLNQADIPYCVTTDAKGNVYVAGYGTNLVGNTGADLWIKKFASDGTEDTTYWDKKFDGNGGNDYIRSIAIDSKGNVYVAGFGDNLNASSSVSDIWIKKFIDDRP